MIFLLFCVFGVASAVELPAGVKLCHRSDPNFQKCVGKNMGDALKYFANGNKALGLPKMDPFFVEKLEIAGEPSQSISLEQKYNNVYVYGLLNTRFDNFTIELDNGCSWVTDAISPAVRLNADYEIKGQLLVFPINSHGKCNITQHNLVNRNSMTCEKYTKNNETYIRVLDYSMDMKPEKITFDFENIFAGNDQISNDIVKTLNENSVSIFNEVKGGIERTFSLIYIKYMNTALSKIPLREMFLD